MHSKLQGKNDTIDLANDSLYVFANWFNTSNLISSEEKGSRIAA